MRDVRLHLFAAIFTTALLALPALADDQDRARADVAAGRILPLATIVERATARFGGTVLDAEYEDDDEGKHGDRGRPLRNRYEIKLLTPDGRILELDYDAVTGDLLRQRGRFHERRRERYGHD